MTRSPRAATPKTLGGGSPKDAPGAPAVERPGRGGPGRGGPKSLGKRVALQTDLYATVHTGLAACDPAEYVAQLMVLARTQARLIRARREVRTQRHYVVLAALICRASVQRMMHSIWTLVLPGFYWFSGPACMRVRARRRSERLRLAACMCLRVTLLTGRVTGRSTGNRLLRVSRPWRVHPGDHRSQASVRRRAQHCGRLGARAVCTCFRLRL